VISTKVLGTGALIKNQVLYYTANKHGNSKGDGASAAFPAIADDRIAKEGRRATDPHSWPPNPTVVPVSIAREVVGLSPMAQPPFTASFEVCFSEVFRNGVSGLRNDPGPGLAGDRCGHLLDAGVASTELL